MCMVQDQGSSTRVLQNINSSCVCCDRFEQEIDAGFRVYGLGFRLKGLGCRVLGVGFRIKAPQRECCRTRTYLMYVVIGSSKKLIQRLGLGFRV